MTAPRGVEFDQDILGVIHDNVLVVMGDDNGHRAILALWNRLRLDAGVDLSSDKVVNKLAYVLLGQLLALVERKLLVLGDFLDGERGPLAEFEVQVATVLSEGLGVDGREVDLALVLFGDWLQFLGEGLALLGGFGEDVGKWDTGLSVDGLVSREGRLS